jgi:hypothetical protein
MKRVIAYFADLLSTLKRIEKHLETLASTVSLPYGRSYPSIRQGGSKYDA